MSYILSLSYGKDSIACLGAIEQLGWPRQPVERGGNMPEHILSLSYGKDSMACFGACEILGWPIDRVVTADVWATDTIPADLPPMVEFKAKADEIIKKRWGIKVEHYRADMTFQDIFYRPSKKYGIYAFPTRKCNWCNGELKMPAIKKAINSFKNATLYVGIAVDEPNRFHNLTETKKSPLVEAGWDEAYCRQWCEENNLLSPIYTTTARGGCWFCHNQSVGQLRLLRKNYHELWKLMLKWDLDSPVSFKPDGHTVHDFDMRFDAEDKGLIKPGDKSFRWEKLRGNRDD